MRSRRWPASCRPPWACRCRDSVWPMWHGTPSPRAWWLASATARCGGGCTRTRSVPGSIAAGSSPAIRSSRPRPGASWTCTSGVGKGRRCVRTSSSSPPTRRPAFRPAAYPSELAHRPRRVDARGARIRAPRRLGLLGGAGRPPRQGVRSLRSDHGIAPFDRLVDQVMSQPPYGTRAACSGSWTTAPRTVARPRTASGAGPSSNPSGSWPGPRKLAQPDRNLLLDHPAQGAYPQRLPLPGGSGRAIGELRALLREYRAPVRMEIHSCRPQRPDRSDALTLLAEPALETGRLSNTCANF